MSVPATQTEDSAIHMFCDGDTDDARAQHASRTIGIALCKRLPHCLAYNVHKMLSNSQHLNSFFCIYNAQALALLVLVSKTKSQLSSR